MSPSCFGVAQVAEDIEGKTDMQCFHRWTKVFNGGTKGPWSAEDDARVAELVGEIGAKKWSCIAAQLPGRTGKQCRERWHNHLNPDISKVPWTEREVREEDRAAAMRWPRPEASVTASGVLARRVVLQERRRIWGTPGAGFAIVFQKR